MLQAELKTMGITYRTAQRDKTQRWIYDLVISHFFISHVLPVIVMILFEVISIETHLLLRK